MPELFFLFLVFFFFIQDQAQYQVGLFHHSKLDQMTVAAEAKAILFY